MPVYLKQRCGGVSTVTYETGQAQYLFLVHVYYSGRGRRGQKFYKGDTYFCLYHEVAHIPTRIPCLSGARTRSGQNEPSHCSLTFHCAFMVDEARFCWTLASLSIVERAIAPSASVNGRYERRKRKLLTVGTEP